MDVKSLAEFWDWMEGPVAQALYSHEDYAGKVLDKDWVDYTSNTLRVVGGIRYGNLASPTLAVRCEGARRKAQGMIRAGYASIDGGAPPTLRLDPLARDRGFATGRICQGSMECQEAVRDSGCSSTMAQGGT